MIIICERNANRMCDIVSQELEIHDEPQIV